MRINLEGNWKGFISFAIRKKFIDVSFFLKILAKKFFLFNLNFYGIKKFLQDLGFISLDFKIIKKNFGFFLKILKSEPKTLVYRKKKTSTKYQDKFFFLKKKFLIFLKIREEFEKIPNVSWRLFKTFKNKFILKDSIELEKNLLFFKFFKENLKNNKRLEPSKKKKKKSSVKGNKNFVNVKVEKLSSNFNQKKLKKKKKVYQLNRVQNFRKKFKERTFLVYDIFASKNKPNIILNKNWYSKQFILACTKNHFISFSWGWKEVIGTFLFVFSKDFNEESSPEFSFFNISADFKKKLVQINGTKYEKLELIGKGGTGKVYKIIDHKRKIFALKKIKIHSFGTENLHSCINEISILKILRHHYRVVQLKNADISLKNGLIYMVFEYGECDLNRLLKQNPISLSKDSFLKFLWKQILETVQAIHQERIVHGDLKPANFLIIEGSLKIIDFGIAKPIQNDTTNITRNSQIGTLNYMPPESVLDIPSFCERKKKFRLSRSADVWSLGCILFQMVYGKTPFYHLTMMKKIQAIVNKSFEISFLPTKTPLAIDVLKNCLQRNPDSRPSIPELLKHPFLASENFRISIKKTKLG